MKTAPALLVSILAFCCSNAAFADLGTVVQSAGDWTVYRKVDSFSDQTRCVATYRGNVEIQLTSEDLSFAPKGGVEAYRFRLDDSPPSEMLMAEGVQKQVGVIFLDKDAMKLLMPRSRLRVEAITLAYTTEDFDVSLTSFSAAMDAVKACQALRPRA